MRYSPVKVLLIEDNPGDARLICEMLAEATDGQTEVECIDRLSPGLERLAAGDIDILLLDLYLPDGQGVDVCIRAHTQAQHVPIVVLTGLDDEAMAVTTLQVGAQDYLVKGQVDSRLLLRSIRYAIERKRAEEALRDAEELYKTLASSSPIGVYIVQDGKFQFVNPQFLKLTGFTQDELMGRDSLSIVHPEDREMVRENAIEMLKGRHSSPYEFRCINKCGETI